VKSNTEWIDWGRTDPLFATASWPGRERTGANPWTDEEFYLLGQSDWADFLGHWEAYGLDRRACVEIGCGPGRLTKHIARTFGLVDAIDVAAEMVAYARARIGSVNNVKFHVTNGKGIPMEDASATGAFSAHVFQHFDSLEDAVLYFQEIIRVLAPGGSLMIHLPLHEFPRSGALVAAFQGLYRARQVAGDVRAWYLRKRIRAGRDASLMRGLSFEIGWLQTTLATIGLEQIEFGIFPMRSNSVMHSCVFARKPAS
jgi:SAM-dependent methyltransferase